MASSTATEDVKLSNTLSPSTIGVSALNWMSNTVENYFKVAAIHNYYYYCKIPASVMFTVAELLAESGMIMFKSSTVIFKVKYSVSSTVLISMMLTGVQTMSPITLPARIDKIVTVGS